MEVLQEEMAMRTLMQALQEEMEGDSNEGQDGNDAFVKNGWDGFNKKDRLRDHVGTRPNSFHNTAVKRCNNLMKPDQSIANAINKQRDVTKEEYLARLNTSIDATRFLLHQGLAFRGHDESEKSKNKGNFRESVQLLAKQNEKTEQMAVVLRYVDKLGLIKERLIGVVHVSETSASCLKSNIDNLFAKYGLSMTQVRGQGYDRASNMRVLKYVEKEGPTDAKRRQARGLLDYMKDFDFVFSLKLMLLILGHANSLSLSLQRKDKDILEAMTEVNFELLTNVAAFNPKNSFDAFKSESLLELAKAYPSDFDSNQLDDLSLELNIYIDNVRADLRFAQLDTISELGSLMTDLRNRIEDEFMNDCVVCFVKQEFLDAIPNDDVIVRFQNMDDRTRRVKL
ncbi:uncharacterized protein [Miscanthus floridulus]|uniref:uncharacterized protein n=1 Tax=Miscanthus floridulus TaxID=154761 RepID=UPI0034589284